MTSEKRKQRNQRLRERNEKKYQKKEAKRKNPYPTQSSGENKKWEKKRIKRYHDTVWKEWRETDGEKHPIVISYIEPEKKD